MPALASLLLIAWAGGEPVPPVLDVGQKPAAIYGGEPVEPGAWPGVVAVTAGIKRCTGTLVSPELVLTAAHCFDPEPSTSVVVHFGDSVDTPSMEVFSDNWGAHEDFCLPSECGEDIHDFAWIRLPEPVAVEPLPPITNQAEFDEAMVPGHELVFVGYGKIEDGTAGPKREVTSTLTSFNESGREFRAGGDGKDTCEGDSGGPALVVLASGEVRLAGVLSRGGECGSGGIYGVPMPELCWLRDASGVDLLPNGCETCECVVLRGAPVDEGCGCTFEREGAPWRALGELGLLLALLGWRARSRGE